ncbi:hypothetical protein HJG60_011412 [Phyllostomus discolor]|uniref:Uncharacterized protein n=1 Tax=Phyllostomus discolor TaxID=89673 RepID=A0A834E7U6_9CHIR|nr:hypothetical protein HJG60_011412 [Phyllostomus discolor]
MMASPQHPPGEQRLREAGSSGSQHFLWQPPELVPWLLVQPRHGSNSESPRPARSLHQRPPPAGRCLPVGPLTERRAAGEGRPLCPSSLRASVLLPNPPQQHGFYNAPGSQAAPRGPYNRPFPTCPSAAPSPAGALGLPFPGCRVG